MGASQECSNFIASLLTVDPKARATAKTALQHPWITGGDFRADPGAVAASARPSLGNASVATKLRIFKKHSKLQRTALLAVSFGAPTASHQELTRIFQSIDTDNDGMLSIDEFTEAMTNQGMTDVEEIRSTYATKMIAIFTDARPYCPYKSSRPRNVSSPPSSHPPLLM